MTLYIAAGIVFLIHIIFILLIRNNADNMKLKREYGEVVQAKVISWKAVSGRPTRYIIKVEFERDEKKENKILVTSERFAKKYEYEKNAQIVIVPNSKKVFFEEEDGNSRNIALFFFLIISLSIFVNIVIVLLFNSLDQKNEKMIAGYVYDYAYHNRKLTIDEFEQFDYDTTYGEIVEALGEENGNVGSGSFYPYYELLGGKYAIIRFYPELNHIRSIDIANKYRVLYSILPSKIPHKEIEQKEKEIALAKQYEMNIILDLLRVKEWVKPLPLKENDEPLGEYSAGELKKYADYDWNIKIDYQFEDYESLNGEPLFQSIKIYKDNVEAGYGLITWSGFTIIDSELIAAE